MNGLSLALQIDLPRDWVNLAMEREPHFLVWKGSQVWSLSIWLFVYLLLGTTLGLELCVFNIHWLEAFEWPFIIIIII